MIMPNVLRYTTFPNRTHVVFLPGGTSAPGEEMCVANGIIMLGDGINGSCHQPLIKIINIQQSNM